jgi:putative ABC transport system substrate-binding protein
MQEELMPKMLENFAAVLPAQGRVAILYNVNNPVHSRLWAAAEGSARALKLRVKRYDVVNRDAIPGVLDAIGHDKQDGIFVLPDDPLLTERRAMIAEFGNRNRMPTIHATSEFVDAGGLMSYGQSFADGYRQAAGYVDRILKGTKPQTLPVAQPTKFDLSVNLKSAREMGLTIPQSVLIRADKVVD